MLIVPNGFLLICVLTNDFKRTYCMIFPGTIVRLTSLPFLMMMMALEMSPGLCDFLEIIEWPHNDISQLTQHTKTYPIWSNGLVLAENFSRDP